MIRLFILSVFCFLCFQSFAEDSCHIRISLITLSPGDELYTVFGHSAIRVKDSLKKEDLIYNYGTFDFNEPNFLTKFINGKLLYYVSNEDFIPFIQYYQSEGRTITEQVLNLTCQEKNNILSYLYNNLQGDNKFYKYDFLSDNCTSRLRDIIQKNATEKISFKRVVTQNSTYRNLLHHDLDYHDHQWIKMGIDLLLGSRTDKTMNDQDALFLPDYLKTSFANSTKAGQSFVQQTIDLSANANSVYKKQFFKGPLFFFSLFALFIFYLTYLQKPRVNEILYRFDSFMFFVIGLIGWMLIYLWIVSDQSNYKDNYNLLWAVPTHFIFSFFSQTNKPWINYYFKSTFVIYVLLLLAWFWIPQCLNSAYLPIIIMVMVRSGIRGFKNVKKLNGRKVL